MDLDRVALDLGHEDRVLDLLDREVEDEHRERGLGRDRNRHEERRDRRQDRADDRQQLEEAGQDGEEEREATEHGVNPPVQQEQAHERGEADRQPEDQLPAHPAAEDLVDDVDDRPDVGAPFGWQRAVEGGRQPWSILEQVEDPERDDEEPEDGADEPRQRAEDRQQDRWVEATRALAEVGERPVEEIADVGRELEPLVRGADPSGERVERLQELGQVLDEVGELAGEWLEGDVQELDDEHDRDRVDDQDRQPARQPDRPQVEAGESLDRRIEQVHEEEPDDERGERLATQVEEDADDDRADEHERGAGCRRTDARTVGWRRRPGRDRGRVSPWLGELLHRRADYQT